MKSLEYSILEIEYLWTELIPRVQLDMFFSYLGKSKIKKLVYRIQSYFFGSGPYTDFLVNKEWCSVYSNWCIPEACICNDKDIDKTQLKQKIHT